MVASTVTSLLDSLYASGELEKNLKRSRQIQRQLEDVGLLDKPIEELTEEEEEKVISILKGEPDVF